MCDYVTFKYAIHAVLSFLHTVPSTCKVLLLLPSLKHYELFWQPLDEMNFKHPLNVTGVCNKMNGGGGCIIVHSQMIQNIFDVVVSFNNDIYLNTSNILRVKLEGNQEISHENAIDLRQPAESKRQWQFIDDIHAMGKEIITTLIQEKKRCASKSIGIVGHIPNYLIVVISSSRKAMDDIYSELRNVGVIVLLNDKQKITTRRKHIPNVIIVRDDFLEMHTLVTFANRVYVLDSMIKHCVMESLWKASHTIPVVVCRKICKNIVHEEEKDTRFETLDDDKFEFPTIVLHNPFYSYNVASLFDSLTLQDLGFHVNNGYIKFSIMQQSLISLQAWISVDIILKMERIVRDNVLVHLPYDVCSVFDKIHLLSSLIDTGMPNFLTPVDWASLTTLLLCEVLGVPLLFGRSIGHTSRYPLERMTEFTADISAGISWVAYVQTQKNSHVVYDFINSASLAMVDQLHQQGFEH